MRCIGLGECRKHDYGTMCPSYMATLEERHSTRGRARLLWELLQNEVLTDSWKNEEVKEALDLCLSCKACKSECPTNVDLATYRAEFLAHYFEGAPASARSLRVRIDRQMGRARIAHAEAGEPGDERAGRDEPREARAPPGTAARDAPPRHRRALRSGRARRTCRRRDSTGASGTREVILWADTFNNYFHPDDEPCGVRRAAGGGCCA